LALLTGRVGLDLELPAYGEVTAVGAKIPQRRIWEERNWRRGGDSNPR
jgi:hypothetical protein